MNKLSEKIYGCLVGGLIGDAMGAPGEGKTYKEILERFGSDGITDFEGQGTDDTAIRGQLIWAILESNGYPSVDDFARSFFKFKDKNRRLWFVPVRNAFHKVEEGLVLPAYAGWGNMQSSSTAMAFSPVGVINACNPRHAVEEAMALGSFIHNGPSGFCRDGAAAISAAVAEAFRREATVESILAASTDFLPKESAAEMIGLIKDAIALSGNSGSYESFRDDYYARYLRTEICDSRETVPAVLAIFKLANGDPKQAILWGANFGRDADTIGTMVGGLAGAFRGIGGIPSEWVKKVETNPEVSYREYLPKLEQVVVNRLTDSRGIGKAIDDLTA